MILEKAKQEDETETMGDDSLFAFMTLCQLFLPLPLHFLCRML